MENDRFWLLIARKFAGEATAAELEELDSLLSTQEEYKAAYKTLSLYWKQESLAKETQAETAFQKTLAKIRDTPQEPAALAPLRQGVKPAIPRLARRLFPVASIAAALLISLSLGYFALEFASSESVWPAVGWVEKQNTKGTKSKISLPDGSIVWLNADSKIKFPEKFTGTREVYLSGEAFFDVARLPDQPFIIYLKNSKIKVLGTSFNVKAFEEEDVVETSVVNGRVAFIPEKTVFTTSHDTLVVTPNYKAVYFSKTGKVVKQETNGSLDKAWTEGKLIFKAMRFEEIGKILERTYGKKISFANQAIKNCRITASFHQESLEEVMFILAKTKDYTCTYTGNELVVSGSGC